jgi:3-methyladenine DNA glycosylase Mpg
LLHNGVDVTDPGSELHVSPGLEKAVTIATPRIGISRETDRKWRFVLLDPGNGFKSVSAFASRKATFIK